MLIDRMVSGRYAPEENGHRIHKIASHQGHEVYLRMKIHKQGGEAEDINLNRKAYLWRDSSITE